MPRYLDDDWFAAVSAVLDQRVSVERRVAVRQTVTDGPTGDVTWVVAVEPGGIGLSRDGDEATDVSFTQSYATAAAVARGDRSAQAAFMAGDITLSGDAEGLIAAAPALAALGDALAAVRSTTTY